MSQSEGARRVDRPRRVKEYYDARAEEYDEWYLGLGRFDGLKRPEWDGELRQLELVIAALASKANPGRRLRNGVSDAAPVRRANRARPERAHARDRT